MRHGQQRIFLPSVVCLAAGDILKTRTLLLYLMFLRQEEEHIKNVTQLFCDWVASLGGDSNNIDESTITSLFASGYETKPALSVPIHVVELASVPPELRTSAAPVQSVPQPSSAQTKPDKPVDSCCGLSIALVQAAICYIGLEESLSQLS